MPQVELAREKSHKVPLVAAGVAAGVIVVIVAGVMILAQLRAPQPDAKAVLNRVQELTFADRDNEAIALLQDQIDKTRNSVDKLSMYMQLGSIYENQGNNKAAVETYQKADKITSSFGTQYAIARAAEAGGDKTLALEYYKKCQTMLKSGKSKQNDDYLPIIEGAIVRLEGKS